MRAADEEWVRAAMTDDNLVVELLIKLHGSPPLKEASTLPPLEWSVRQRRSKSVSVNDRAKKPAPRASPTTPLSWSGGTGGGGSEESTRQPSRSKVLFESEKTASKRSRKKKTLAELKGEEYSLWKERRELKRDIAALHMNLDRQRAANEKLKRMKIELQPQMDSESTFTVAESTSGQHKPQSSHFHSPAFPPPIKQLDVSANDVMPQSPNAHPQDHAGAASDSKFILPDLNIPFGEPNNNIISGVS